MCSLTHTQPPISHLTTPRTEINREGATDQDQDLEGMEAEVAAAGEEVGVVEEEEVVVEVAKLVELTI